MSKVCLMSEQVTLPRLNVNSLTSWIEAVARAHGKTVGTLTYIFCDDEYILATNREFLQHDYYTDIITFDYSNSRRVAGDMVISLDTVSSNAIMLGHSYNDELLRVIIHGVLHLCGINDKGPGEREIMEYHENQALDMVPTDIFSHD